MINTPLSEVLNIMREKKFSLYVIKNGGNVIALNDDPDLPSDDAARNVETFFNSVEAAGSVGTVEVALHSRTMKDRSQKGGKVTPDFNFTVKVGGQPMAAPGIGAFPQSSKREDSLRDELEKERQKNRDLEWQMKLDELERKYDAKIAGLEETEPEEEGLTLQGILAIPEVRNYFMQFLPKPNQPATALAGHGEIVDEMKDEVKEEEYTEDDLKIDDAIEKLIANFGKPKVAQLLQKLSAKDPKQLESFFPML